VHIAVRVPRQGALQLGCTRTFRRCIEVIHLDADARLCRLGADSFLNGGTVITATSYVILNGHVLTVTKADASINLIFENPYILAPGDAGGLAVSNGCVFTMRANTNWQGGEVNVIRIEDNARLAFQQDVRAWPWAHDYASRTASIPVLSNLAATRRAARLAWDRATTLAKNSAAATRPLHYHSA
jgi:hypothetical protein